MTMPAVALLAGGLATRLRPITENIPKAMVEVAGEPFIAHQLRKCAREGVDRIVICAGYLGEMIEAYVGDGAVFGIEARYSHDGERLLGTGGALKRALPLLGETFVILYGDSWLDVTYQPIADAFQNSGKQGLMTVFRNDSNWDTSNVEFSGGAVINYNKRLRTPAMRYIDWGMGLLSSEALREWPNDTPFDLADVYTSLLQKDQLVGHEVETRFYEIGSPQGLAETDRLLRKFKKY